MPVGQNDDLAVVANLEELLGASVHVADDRLSRDDPLAVQPKDEAQHPMRRRVLRPDVEHHVSRGQVAGGHRQLGRHDVDRATRTAVGRPVSVGAVTDVTNAGPFVPPAQGWNRVSPKLATVRRIVGLAWVLVLGAVASIAAFVAGPLWLGAVAVLASIVVFLWVSWVIGRQVAAIGYAERQDDLVVTSGILFRRLVVVPYGRMQLVDVTAGPLHRYFGIATLQLHTAAATTDATIPGLPREQAQGLRDRLAALGEARSAGL